MSFFQNEMEFLGHQVSARGIRPLTDKVQAIYQMLPPISLRDIQVILSLIGYYQQFIPNFADVAKPLFYLLQKGIPFEWSAAQEQSFNYLRTALTKAFDFTHPQFDKPFFLHTDSRNVAIGAILSQGDKEQKDHPVAFYRKTLPKAERNTVSLSESVWS